MMKAVGLSEFGGPENFSIVETAKPTAGEGEILIKAVACGINRADTLQRKGKYPPPPGASTTLGLEMAGVVEAVGPNATKFAVGDRVGALLAGGGYAEYATVSEDHAMAIPPTLTWEQGAAIPEVWLTAFQLLHLVGDMQKGDIVLVHAGASGVGTAAIQLIVAAGGTAIATVGSEAKIEAAKQYGAVAAFNRHDGPWADSVKAATDGKGVNLILDCVASNYWEQNSDVLAMDARWVVFGLMSGPNVDGDLLGRILRKRIRITGTTLRARKPEYKANLVARFAAEALPLIGNGTMKSVIDKTFPLADVGDAHRLMETNTTIGKVLLIVDAAAAASSL
eukprot:gene1695-34608_t